MTSAAEGRELTQVGAGTVMGELMRQYWIPAAQSAELVRDGAPIRLMLLGEKLIAFRDTEGRVGVMDHRCPHRCASLFLGRNEEGASAASITAGNTMSRATVSTWRACLRTRISSMR
jgi:nitrite reductase/ring-hydroxylating ferredoxin subunit